MRTLITAALLTMTILVLNASGNTDTDKITYREARQYLFGTLHLKRDRHGYYVKDVYCNKKIREGVGRRQIPKVNVINCEHTWPQSKFSKKYPTHLQKNDLHHLFPVDARTNSSRSNHIFGEVLGGPANDGCYGSKKGRVIGSSELGFEPPEEHKGNVARAMFYFSWKYDMRIAPLQEEYLREWHYSDPVDYDEMVRNDLIEDFQGNRNPFIDNPGMVNEVRDF